jgi:hypothetical protein
MPQISKRLPLPTANANREHKTPRFGGFQLLKASRLENLEGISGSERNSSREGTFRLFMRGPWSDRCDRYLGAKEFRKPGKCYGPDKTVAMIAELY